jgi:hypothetical protein
MKRQLTSCALCTFLTSPLMAQDPYDSRYGYSPEPAYDANDNSRQFNINPGHMMNGFDNPMRNMFGSSRRPYNEYPTAGHAPPYYPPAYGYPAYPSYRQPYPGSGYPSQQQLGPGYSTPYGYPQAYPEPAAPPPKPAMQTPTHGTTPPPTRGYQPMATNPGQAGEYRFRPLDEPPTPEGGEQAPQTIEVPATSPGPVTVTPSAPASREPEPMAPRSYPDRQPQPPAPQSQVHGRLIEQEPNLMFRPLDKPGYSSDLGQ